MKEYVDYIVILIRKGHIVYQAWLWSRIARCELKRCHFEAAQIAMDKFDQLNDMI